MAVQTISHLAHSGCAKALKMKCTAAYRKWIERFVWDESVQIDAAWRDVAW